MRDTVGNCFRSASEYFIGRSTKPWMMSRCFAGSIFGILGVMALIMQTGRMVTMPYPLCIGVKDAVFVGRRLPHFAFEL